MVDCGSGQFYRARYYSPTFGRFISEDPAGFNGGINLYEYTGDNPISFTDPFGTDKNKDKGCGWTPDPNATPYDQPIPNRNAGFTQFSFSIGPGIAWSPSVTVDDYGNTYVAPVGVSLGTPGASGGISRGYLPNNPFPSEEDLVNNVSGNNVNVCGAYGLLGCKGWTPGAPPGDATSAQLGIGTPAASVSWSYAWKLPWKLFHKKCE